MGGSFTVRNGNLIFHNFCVMHSFLLLKIEKEKAASFCMMMGEWCCMRAGRTRKKIADDKVNLRLNNCKFWLKMFHPKRAKHICSEEKKAGKKGQILFTGWRRRKKVDIMGTFGKGITMRVEKCWSQFHSPPQYFFDSWWTLSSDRALQQKSTPHLLQMVPELKHYFCRPYWY